MNCANLIAHPRKRIDKPARLLHHLHIAFKTATGLGGPNTMADSRLFIIAAIFTSVRNTIGASISMAGSGGGVLARAGSIVPVRQPYHLPVSPLGGEELGLIAHYGGIHA